MGPVGPVGPAGVGAVDYSGIVDASSAAISVGDCVCVTATGTLTRAVFAALNLAGAVLGVAISAGTSGQTAIVRMDGVLSAFQSGVSSFGPVRCNTTTARCEAVLSFAQGDYQIGFSTATGVVTMSRQSSNPPTVFVYSSIGGLMADFNGNVGATVSQWTDQTANANHLVQPTPANQPTIITAGLNGLKTVRMDGVASFMRNAAFLLNRNEITIVVVSALRTEGSNPHLATYGGASNLGRLYYSAASGNALLQRGATNAVWTSDRPLGHVSRVEIISRDRQMPQVAG